MWRIINFQQVWVVVDSFGSFAACSIFRRTFFLSIPLPCSFDSIGNTNHIQTTSQQKVLKVEVTRHDYQRFFTIISWLIFLLLYSSISTFQRRIPFISFSIFVHFILCVCVCFFSTPSHATYKSFIQLCIKFSTDKNLFRLSFELCNLIRSKIFSESENWPESVRLSENLCSLAWRVWSQ